MRCLSVSASLAARVDQDVEMTAKTDIQIMSVILSTVRAGKTARISRFSSTAASRQGKQTRTCCCASSAACNRLFSLLASCTTHFCMKAQYVCGPQAAAHG